MEEEFLYYVFNSLESANAVAEIINNNCNAIWDTPKQRVTDSKWVVSYVSDSLQAWRFEGVPEGQTIEPYADDWYGSGE